MKDNKLRKEISKKCSGKLKSLRSIYLLREKHYVVKDIQLDGDAPKQFIKAWFYESNGKVRKAKRKTWNSYIAKTAEKWYPHESVIEYMINRIGQVLGLNMNDVKLVVANNQVRFLSKYFLNKQQRLVHGAEICGEHLGDMEFAKEIADNKPRAREFFTFEFIKEAIEKVYDHCCENILTELVKMIVFDAIVGNNDRHFYNWGVIDSKKKSSKIPIFAPIYDSARAFYWNSSDTKIFKDFHDYFNDGKKIARYITSGCPRISIEDNKQANHFELIKFLKGYSVEYNDIITELASLQNEEKIRSLIRDEFERFFIKERVEVILIILRDRFNKIRTI